VVEFLGKGISQVSHTIYGVVERRVRHNVRLGHGLNKRGNVYADTRSVIARPIRALDVIRLTPSRLPEPLAAWREDIA
jgi:hypothetical protein